MAGALKVIIYTHLIKQALIEFDDSSSNFN